MIAPEFASTIENELLKTLGHDLHITGSQSVSGGSINQACKLNTSKGPLFLKYNTAKAFPGMFELEVSALRYLKKKAGVLVPECLLQSTAGSWDYIVMEWIDSNPTDGCWSNGGRQLARLHKFKGDLHGWSEDNYIGTLRQENDQDSDWHNFFFDQRIGTQLKLAGNKLDPGTIEKFLRLRRLTESWFEDNTPRLLHGDLWIGNLMRSSKGAVLIDPAIYFGCREVDIAMAKLFGGFNNDFFETYNEQFPLDQGWKERIKVLNLYPLLVHFNLFGYGYLKEIQSILNLF